MVGFGLRARCVNIFVTSTLHVHVHHVLSDDKFLPTRAFSCIYAVENRRDQRFPLIGLRSTLTATLDTHTRNKIRDFDALLRFEVKNFYIDHTPMRYLSYGSYGESREPRDLVTRGANPLCVPFIAEETCDVREMRYSGNTSSNRDRAGSQQSYIDSRN